GTTVDPSAVSTTVTTIHWGDAAGAATDSVFTHVDPALIAAGDTKLAHSYATNGTYDLTVTLNDGLSGTGHGATTTHIPITVNANGPTAAINATQSAPFTVTADLTGSAIDTGATGGVAKYDVDWGDGTAATPNVQTYSSITPAPTHKYAAA